jgi:hypothetical protein
VAACKNPRIEKANDGACKGTYVNWCLRHKFETYDHANKIFKTKLYFSKESF